MKHISKILLAVVALFAVSCVTDTTEDVGVDLANGGAQTTIAISLEESRTQLGEKAGDLYPLYWSEGDKVAVNGVASAPLAAESNGSATATFSVDGVIDYPYNIVYPAPAEAAKVITETVKETITETTVDPDTGETTTTETEVDKELSVELYPITFPAEQTYKAGTIADGVAPMYGYAEAAGEQIALNHLTGILRFAVTGEVTLSKIVVKSEMGAIAGTYYVRCSNGQLVVKEESTSNEISMSFGEGLVLDKDVAQPIHIVVPKGNYGVFVATLHATTGEKMTVRFDTNSKPISVGKVREFAPFVFMANDYDATEAFEIYDIATLRAFAASASANTFYPRTEAKLMANIDMTGEEWTPIEGFRFTFNGNNNSIIGLSAPLFGTTSGVIKDLKLENVALVSNGNIKMGSVACVLASTGYANKAAVINCEASGTLTVSNPEWEPTDEQDKDASIVNYGGLVGAAIGADVTGSTNNVAITVELMQKKGNAMVVYSSIAGVVGLANVTTLVNGEEACSVISNCKNNAPISYVDTTSAETKALVNGPRIGTILGCGIKGAELLSCENTVEGKLTLNSYFYGAGAASGGMPVGGIVGYTANGVVNNCTNRADVEVDGTLKAINLGGIGGYITYCWNDELHNYGNVTIKETARLRGLSVGGVAGMFYGNGANTDHTFGNCVNHGDIKVLASHEENFATSGTKSDPFYYRIGGITGFGRTKTTGGCTNNGDITVSGNIKIAANSQYKEEALVVAGCIGFKTSGHPAGRWENNGDILFDATVTYDDDAAAIYHPISISGCFGPQPGNPDEGYNNGNITFNGKYEGNAVHIDIGGLYAGGQDTNGYNNKTPLKGKNTGNITIGDDAAIGTNLYVGGIIGTTLATTAPTSLVNEGDITISEKVTIGGKLYAGGAYGYFKGGNIKNVSNSGDINIYGNVNGRACVGGICVYGVTGKTATDVINTGNIVASGTYKGGVYAGGVFSELAKGDTGNLTRVVNGALGTNGLPDPNKGKITISGFCDNDVSTSGQSALIIGGLCGGTNYDRRPGNMNDCHNYGTLEASGTFHGRIYFSGFSMACMSAGKTITNCSQEGDLIFSGKMPNKTNGTIYMTGFAYTIDKAFTITNFQNKGNLIISESAEIAEVVYMMGYGYRNSAATYDGCSFSGNIIHNGKQTANTVYMSALAGERFSAIIKNGYTNSGNVSFGGTYSGGGYLYISGLGTLYGTPTFGGTILNTGTISFTGKSTHADSKIRLGGLFASVPNTVTTLDGTAETVDFVNKSNIIATGESAGAVAVGGIAAIAAAPITAAKSYSNIEATNSAVVGWITSSERTDTVKAINCAVGGMRITGWDDSDSEPVPTGTKINSATFHNYIYGSVDWTNVENYDGCRLLPSSEVNF